MAEATNATVIAKFFGKLPGQNLADVMAEMRELTDEDKAQLAGGIKDESLNY